MESNLIEIRLQIFGRRNIADIGSFVEEEENGVAADEAIKERKKKLAFKGKEDMCQ